MLGWASQGGNWFDGVWEEGIILGGDVSRFDNKMWFLGEIVDLSKKIGKDVRRDVKKDVKNLDKSDEG